MKISKTLTPAVALLAFGVGLGLAFFTVQRTATAETSSPQLAGSETQADASPANSSPVCEMREVEMDEGYALTRKESRRVCH